MARKAFTGASDTSTKIDPNANNSASNPTTSNLESVLLDAEQKIEDSRPRRKYTKRSDKTGAQVTTGTSVSPEEREKQKLAIARGIEPIYRQPFSMAAHVYDVKELALEDSEAKEGALALAELSLVAGAKLTPMQAAMLGVITTVGVTTFAKFMIYQEIKKQRLAETVTVN